jgi:hypothetical protein
VPILETGLPFLIFHQNNYGGINAIPFTIIPTTKFIKHDVDIILSGEQKVINILLGY